MGVGGGGSKVMMVGPSESIWLADKDGIPKDNGGEADYFLKMIKSSRLVLIFVYSDQLPRHYTYLELLADETKTPPWIVTYRDSLKDPSQDAMAVARRILINLGLQALVDQVIPSNKILQSDGWACGLFVLRWIEAACRKYRNEPRIPPCPLTTLSNLGLINS